MTLAEAVAKADKDAVVEILRNAPDGLWLPGDTADPPKSILIYTWVFKDMSAGDYQVQIVPSGS